METETVRQEELDLCEEFEELALCEELEEIAPIDFSLSDEHHRYEWTHPSRHRKLKDFLYD